MFETKLETFEPGTQVVVQIDNILEDSYYITEITRQTKTQFLVAKPPGRRFKKDTNRMIGNHASWRGVFARPLNTEYQNRVDKYNNATIRKDMIDDIKYADWKILSTKQISEILSLLNNILVDNNEIKCVNCLDDPKVPVCTTCGRKWNKQ